MGHQKFHSKADRIFQKSNFQYKNGNKIDGNGNKIKENQISFAKTLKLLTPDSDNNYTSNVTLVMNSPAGVSAK